MVSFTNHEGLRQTYSPGTVTHQCDEIPVFPPQTAPVSLADAPCACLLTPLFAFLSLTQELPKICFRQHSCKMTEAVIKSPSSSEELFIILISFPCFLRYALPCLTFPQLLLLCGRPKSEKEVSTCNLKIVTARVALPS